MFGIGGFELFLILLFGFLVFGPDKLPEIAKTIGRAIAKFRDAQAEVTSTLQNVAFDKNSDEPFKNPFDSAAKVKATAQRSAAAAKDTASSVKASVQASGAEAAGSAAEAGSVQAASAAAESARESFSERKARYERERKAKAQADSEKTDQPKGSGPGDSSPATQASQAPVAGPNDASDFAEKGGA